MYNVNNKGAMQYDGWNTVDIDTQLKAIADGTRRGILSLLKGGRRSVLEIAEEFPVSRPAISKHLRILKEAGLVLETPDGRQRFYTLEGGPLEQIREWLAGLNGGRGAGRPRTQSRSGVGGRRPALRAPRIGLRGEDWRVW
jgi:DNA-binding transcriptional ArsR family regulator